MSPGFWSWAQWVALALSAFATLVTLRVTEGAVWIVAWLVALIGEDVARIRARHEVER